MYDGRILYNINDLRTIDEKIKDYPKLVWTGSKNELILIVRALVKSGRINNGLASIKDVIHFVQIIFNVDLKDYHRKYQDIKGSHDPTKFLDYLKEVIIDDIDQSDEKGHQSKGNNITYILYSCY
ncbi:MAG: RteC domain-containing protein [Saprospiraceae bacterium]|nr:RteC domain-containing protein [Saprospiraceae bacterium]